MGGERLDALAGGSKPMARSFFWISKSFTTSTIAAPSFCAHVFGHARRAVQPSQPVTTTPGTPASSKVGTFGSIG